MLFTDELYSHVEKIWGSYYEHPFVDELGSGKLNKEKFKHYMIQDYLYLLDYAKVFSLGAIKSEDEETMAKFSSLAEGTLHTEMATHRKYMERLGITKKEVENAKPALANLSYTHYMLAVSYAGGIIEIAVSVLACLWSYECIGRHLYKKYGIKDNFYAEWIESYISEEYHELTIWLLELVNKYGEGINEKKKEKLIDIFVNTSRFEYIFWDMAYNIEN